MAPKPGRPAPNLFAKAATKLVLATTIVAFCLTVAPTTAAAANGQISAARAAAIHECSLLAENLAPLRVLILAIVATIVGC